MSEPTIHEEVKNKAEKIENMESPEELREEIQEVKVWASIDGLLSEITVVTDIGGPHIEVNLFSGTVSGSWSMETAKVPIFDEDVEDNVLGPIADFYESQWYSQTLKSDPR